MASNSSYFSFVGVSDYSNTLQKISYPVISTVINRPSRMYRFDCECSIRDNWIDFLLKYSDSDLELTYSIWNSKGDHIVGYFIMQYDCSLDKLVEEFLSIARGVIFVDLDPIFYISSIWDYYKDGYDDYGV